MAKGNPNPSPATRFGAANGNPQSPGGWKPEVTFSYQYKRFMSMPSVELDSWLTKNKDTMTVVEHLAYKRVLAAKISLPDVREMTDRTEGKAPQSVDLTSGGEQLSNLIYMPVKKSDKYDADNLEG